MTRFGMLPRRLVHLVIIVFGITVVTFFLLRLIIFGGVIYGSLKCFQGSAIALLFGLSLAIVAMMWEALRLLRD